jgi:flagellar assembly protein FliH
MSSRILKLENLESVEALLWRPVGTPQPGPDDPHPNPESGHKDTEGQEQQPVATSPEIPQGPTWEEYQSLQLRIKELETLLPLREKEAREKARAQAQAEQQEKWSAALENSARSVAGLATFRPRLRREAEQDVVRLSLAMARRLLRREVSIDKEALIGLLRTALDRLDQRETSRVRVRPEDAAFITAYLDHIGSPQRIEVTPDPALERGGLIFETSRGEMDASIETQLEEIERGFADVLHRKAIA